MKHRLPLVLTLSFLAGQAWGVPPNPSTEGIDLMRQITTQWVRPNLLLVLDISGSMSWDMWGAGVGTDGRGGATGNADKPQWVPSGPTSGCSSGKKKYTFTLTFRYPSRMATVKNALGNSVTIWQAPSSWRQSSFWPTVSGWSKTVTTGVSNTVTYTSNTCLSTPPELPAELQNIPIPDPIPPQDLVGGTADKVNWGLVVYSGNYANCSRAELVARIDTADTGDVTSIENAMRLQNVGGLPATGGTPTRGALEFAKTVIQAVKNGGTVQDYSSAFGGNSFSFPPDPKRTCGRSYSVLLVTDGQSNVCNVNVNSSYCWQDPATNRCDGTSGYRCPNNLISFPAGKSRELWQTMGVRTFAVGVSESIGPCELNHVAFEGKTDASSPNGDAGFNSAADPRLATYSLNDSQLPSSSNPPYAFFTSNAQEFRNAISQILAALGTGDYVTSAPAVSGMAGVASGIGLLASVDYPQFKGHLYAYDVSRAVTPFPLLWDAGQVLVTGMRMGSVLSPPVPNNGLPRSVYTWKPNGALLKLEVTTSVANQLNTICGNCGITTQVIDFILGNNGSGTARAWKLGASVNSTPAVISRPVEWKQATNRATERKAFEEAYQSRHPLVWVGGSDGLLHAFDLVDGAEVLAILPPTMIARQVGLYQRYISNPVKFPTGQPMLPQDHVYGVANSVRFADIYIPNKGFRTALFVTEGPGGTGIHALDVTHPYPGRTNVSLPDGSTQDFAPDPGYTPAEPFTVLWSYTKTGEYGTQALAALRQT
ncbi:MAG: PilC/PilY family type IV pilus protein, partial [Thermoanaerobaculum sp.]